MSSMRNLNLEEMYFLKVTQPLGEGLFEFNLATPNPLLISPKQTVEAIRIVRRRVTVVLYSASALLKSLMPS